MTDKEKVDILIVDDLAEKILVLESILEEMDENLVTARSGEEALRQVLERDFAVILLDVNMPGMDGFETAAFIRSRKRSAHVPIIFITAFTDEMHTAQGYSLGAVDYIFSPVVPEVLRTKVKVFVELFRMAQQVRRQADQRVMLAHEQAARAAAEEATRRSAFLAEASNVLSSSLDFDVTLAGLARFVVPFLGDLAAVARVDDDAGPTRTALACADDAAELHTQTFEQFTAVFAPLTEAVTRAIRRHRVEHLSDAGVHVSCGAAKEVRLEHVLILPMRARGRTLGVLLLATGLSGRHYNPADVALAEDLAGRAGIALDNARLYQNIQEGDRRKNEFMAMLAHELRNPLAPICNAVQVIRLLGASDPRLEQARDMIDRQVNHMARLIDDLLDMSRLSRGKILLRKERLDLADVVRTALEDYRSMLEANRLKVRLTLPEGPIPIDGDPTRLAQVVGNVLNNANKFTDPGGAVSVGVERNGTTARITVRDTGIGIDRPMLERLFETFSQADRSLDRSRGGLGLGLALVRGLIDLHGGEVKASSEGLGKGAEIVISLPLAEEIAALEPTSAVPVPVAAPSRVLVVEDNADAAESLRTLFFLTGHQVEIAHTGPQALELAQAFRPEIILCDIGLPGGMDGYDVARTIRHAPDLASVYLVALTGYGQESDKRRSREAGFDAHFTKPIDFADLQRHLASLTEVARG